MQDMNNTTETLQESFQRQLREMNIRVYYSLIEHGVDETLAYDLAFSEDSSSLDPSYDADQHDTPQW